MDEFSRGTASARVPRRQLLAPASASNSVPQENESQGRPGRSRSPPDMAAGGSSAITADIISQARLREAVSSMLSNEFARSGFHPSVKSQVHKHVMELANSIHSLVKAKRRVEMLEGQVTELSHDRIPHGIRKFTVQCESQLLDRGTLNREKTINFTIPSGTSFREAKRQLHMAFMKADCEVEVELTRAVKDSWASRTSFDSFCTSIMHEHTALTGSISSLGLELDPSVWDPNLIDDTAIRGRAVLLYKQVAEKCASEVQQAEKEKQRIAKLRDKTVDSVAKRSPADVVGSFVDKRIAALVPSAARKLDSLPFEIDDAAMLEQVFVEDKEVATVASDHVANSPSAKGVPKPSAKAKAFGKGKGNAQGNGQSPGSGGTIQGKGKSKGKAKAKAKGKGKSKTESAVNPPKGKGKGRKGSRKSKGQKGHGK